MILYQALVRNLGEPTQAGFVTPYEVTENGKLVSFGQELLGYEVRHGFKAGVIFVYAEISEGNGKKTTFFVNNVNMDLREIWEYWTTNEDRANKVVRDTLGIPLPSARYPRQRF